MADEKKPTQRRTLPRSQIPLRVTTRRTVEQAARGTEEIGEIELDEAPLATADPFRLSFLIPQSATPFVIRSDIMPANRPGFNAGAAYSQLESEGSSAESIIDIPASEGMQLFPRTQTSMHSTTRRTVQQAATGAAQTKEIELQEDLLALNPFSKLFAISRSATPCETRSEITPEFNAGAANPQMESAGSSTGPMFDIPVFESSHLLPRTQTPLRSTTLRTVEQAVRGSEQTREIVLDEAPRSLVDPFSRSFVIPRSATSYVPRSQIMPVTRPGFNAGAAYSQLESEGPSTGPIFDGPSSEDSHLVHVQQPDTSENVGIRPQLRSTQRRNRMQANPNNTPSADKGSTSK